MLADLTRPLVAGLTRPLAGEGGGGPAAGYEIVLLLGQSNMQGWTDEGPGAEDTTDPRIEQYRMDAGNVGSIVLAEEPLHWPVAPSPTDSVGPCLAFARGVLPTVPTPRKILLIPCAVGNTGLVAPGNSRWGVGDDLFEAAMTAAQAALALPGSNRILAVLWAQGERDASDDVTAKNYYAALAVMIEEIRTRLGDPTIPFLSDGTLPEWAATEPGYIPIREALQAPPTYLSYTHFAEGIAGYVDPLSNTHYSAAGNRIRGARFAANLPVARAHIAPAALDTNAQDIFAAMDTPPNEVRQATINRLVTEAKAAAVWPKPDALFVLAAHDEQAARVDWKLPTRVASTHNTTTFSLNQGYAGDGSSGYLDTGFNPAVDAISLTSTSITYGNWQITGQSGNDTFAGGCYDTDVVGICMRECQENGDVQTNAACTVTTFAAGMVTPVGMTVEVQDAGTLSLFKNGEAVLSPVSVTTGDLPNLNMWIGGLNNQGSIFGASGAKIAIWFVGAAFTPAEQSATYAIFSRYLSSVGAI